MADDSTKGIVIKGPWKKVKRVDKSKTEKIHQDMVYVDDVAETVMIPMIHGLAENGVDIKSDRFITEVGLYDNSQDLIAVAKLSSPVEKNFSNEAVIKVNMTY